MSLPRRLASSSGVGRTSGASSEAPWSFVNSVAAAGARVWSSSWRRRDSDSASSDVVPPPPPPPFSSIERRHRRASGSQVPAAPPSQQQQCTCHRIAHQFAVTSDSCDAGGIPPYVVSGCQLPCGCVLSQQQPPSSSHPAHRSGLWQSQSWLHVNGSGDASDPRVLEQQPPHNPTCGTSFDPATATTSLPNSCPLKASPCLLCDCGCSHTQLLAVNVCPDQVPPCCQRNGSWVDLAQIQRSCPCSLTGSLHSLASNGKLHAKIGNGTAAVESNIATQQQQQQQQQQPSRKSGVEADWRHWGVIGLVLLMAAVTVAGVGVPLAMQASRTSALTQRLQVVSSLLQQVPLVDGHNDLPWNLRNFVHNELTKLPFDADLRHVIPWNQSRWSHTDLPRLRRGQVGAQLWAAYVPCRSQWMDAVSMTLEQVDVMRRLIAKYPEHLQLATSADEMMQAHQAGRIASLISVEGGHSIGNSLAVLRSLYQSGVVSLTLTHTCDTPWASTALPDSSGQHKQKDKGLSKFGQAVVTEMNRLGMIVDLSHSSDVTAREVMAVSRSPVIFSHSSARALCNSTRNVNDDIIKQLVRNGGMVMVSFYPKFISCSNNATLAHVVAHLNYIRRLAGVNHVGIGAGYDGINWTPAGLEDVSKYPSLLAMLLEDASWTEEDVKKLAGLNFLRVFRQVENVSRQMNLERVQPGEERLDPLRLIYTEAARCNYEMNQALNKSSSSSAPAARQRL